MKWESQADIDKFVEYIRDFYNIDSFEDICMNVSIIYADTVWSICIICTCKLKKLSG